MNDCPASVLSLVFYQASLALPLSTAQSRLHTLELLGMVCAALSGIVILLWSVAHAGSPARKLTHAPASAVAHGVVLSLAWLFSAFASGVVFKGETLWEGCPCLPCELELLV